MKLYPRFALLHYRFIALFIFKSLNGISQKTVSIDPGPFEDDSNHWYGIADKTKIINAHSDQAKEKPGQETKTQKNHLNK